jgi:hypothetical protein
VRAPAGDTPPEIEEFLIEALRRMAPADRLARALDLGVATRQLALARIRALHGSHLSPREERLRLASLWLDRDTLVQLFDWDPDAEGY